MCIITALHLCTAFNAEDWPKGGMGVSIPLPSVCAGKATHRGVFARISVRQGQGLQHHEGIWNPNLVFYLLSQIFFFSLVSNSKHNVCTQRCLFTACCPHMWLDFNGMIHTSCRMRALCLHLSIKHWNERIFCSAFFLLFTMYFSVCCYIIKQGFAGSLNKQIPLGTNITIKLNELEAGRVNEWFDWGMSSTSWQCNFWNSAVKLVNFL